MLVVKLEIHDCNGNRQIARVCIVRGKPHRRIKNCFTYSYKAVVDKHIYQGEVLHSYKNGAIALTQKVSRAITKQQKGS